MADLKRMKLLIGWASTVITWRNNSDEVRAAIEVTVNLNCLYPGDYIELKYRAREELINYKIQLVQVASNLGKKGGIWYFICPSTGKRCRTLYSDGRYFVSRHAFKGTLYESQTYSKTYRSIASMYGPIYKVREAFDELKKPYAKTFYRGKLTPKARKLFKWQQLYNVKHDIELRSIEDYLLSTVS
ncbi:hypothetical protein [Spirosoma taeanense]|uniref:hypothetical protein n=1 Tax=Spirosoma taeanense TaxID=2735870 RepID=UPI001964E220|nr:hypothetical protein [Spirosoma taeanense]